MSPVQPSAATPATSRKENTPVNAHTPSRACYQRGCQRPECGLEDYRYRKQLHLDHARGRRRQISAQQAREHIHRLRAAGWTNMGIARAAHVSRCTIDNLAHGQPNTRSWVALAILAVPIGPPPALKPEVDATGSIRRLRALAVIGHPFHAIARHVACSPDTLWLIANGKYETLPPDTAAQITSAYRLLASQPGTSPITRARVARHNWHGPMAWDDIDDPNCEPETEPAADAEPTRADLAAIRRNEIVHLLAFGLSHTEIATRLGMAPDYVRDIARNIRNQLRKAA